MPVPITVSTSEAAPCHLSLKLRHHGAHQLGGVQRFETVLALPGLPPSEVQEAFHQPVQALGFPLQHLIVLRAALLAGGPATRQQFRQLPKGGQGSAKLVRPRQRQGDPQKQHHQVAWRSEPLIEPHPHSIIDTNVRFR